jgi:hypothetical protein
LIASGPAAAAVALLLLPRPPPQEPPAATLHETLASAIAAFLAPAPADADGTPIVLGVGELHQTADLAAIPSSLSRFTREIWPLIAGRASDLIVETWVTDGACGAAETATVDGVARTTERPVASENEIVALLRRARESGVRPHVLTVGCADYQRLSPTQAKRGPAGTVDFQRMLALIRRKLEAKIGEVLAARGGADADADRRKVVVVYGGALHNDLHPDPLLADFSYGPSIFRATMGRYRDLDLYVPKYLQRNPALRQEPWFAVWQTAARPGQIVTIRRSRDSLILVFPTTQT